MQIYIYKYKYNTYVWHDFQKTKKKSSTPSDLGFNTTTDTWVDPTQWTKDQGSARPPEDLRWTGKHREFVPFFVRQRKDGWF